MNKKYLILLLVVLGFIIFGFPLIRYGIERSFFYGIDPDVVYVGNALLYTKYAMISYTDHPGTPTIMFLNYSFYPLRLFAKYILHQGFIQWSFENFSFLTYYLRVIELLLASSALFIYLKVIKKMSNSNWIILFAGLSAYSFAGLSFAIRIVPENLSFFLTALWLLIFLKFIKKQSYFLNLLLVFIAGFTFANKFTSLFLLIPSLLLPIYIKKLKLDQKLVRLQINLLISGFAFYLGILPVVGMYKYIWGWVISLFSHTGDYGTGVEAIFNWPSYSASALALIKGSPLLFAFLFFSLILGLAMVVKGRIKISNPVVLLGTSAYLGIAVFAKYTLIHYNFVNIIIIIFCAAYSLSKLKIFWVKALLPVMAVVFLITLYGYTMTTSSRLGKEPSDTVYSTLNAWTPFWAADIFREQLNTTKP